MSLNTLPKDTAITWEKGDLVCKPTDDSRSEISIGFDEIGESTRMANGRMRKYYVATKRSWATTWSMLPEPDSVVRNGNGGGAIEAFYNTVKGEFQMHIVNTRIDLDETVTVMFSDYSRDVVKRGSYDMWNVSVKVEEV